MKKYMVAFTIEKFIEEEICELDAHAAISKVAQKTRNENEMQGSSCCKIFDLI